eukprot:GHVU01104110.1.p3 GENE.GHVU01104110.1~~GHVU01104110.1.p3  ORF type:complete len:141 (+),score=29.92 GHVU01104110.1:1747-2169(+)
MSLWGEQAKLPDSTFENAPVATFVNAMVKEWRGRSGHCNQSTTFELEPAWAAAECARLKAWYNEDGKHTTFESMREYSIGPNAQGGAGGKPAEAVDLRRLAEIRDEGTELGSLFTVVADVSRIHYRNRDGEFTAIYAVSR